MTNPAGDHFNPFQDYISQATHHKFDVRHVVQAFEADRNLIASVVQVAQMDYDDLITLLHGAGVAGVNR